MGCAFQIHHQGRKTPSVATKVYHEGAKHTKTHEELLIRNSYFAAALLVCLGAFVVQFGGKE
jgi:hypothetical protein